MSMLSSFDLVELVGIDSLIYSLSVFLFVLTGFYGFYAFGRRYQQQNTLKRMKKNTQTIAGKFVVCCGESLC